MSSSQGAGSPQKYLFVYVWSLLYEFAWLPGFPSVILNMVYFKHTQQESDKCALALLMNEVLKISLERHILVQGPNWETCATHAHPKRTLVNSRPLPALN